MKILLLGGGGREHAFALKFQESPFCEKIFIAPGNAGTAKCGTNIDLNPNDFSALKTFVLDQEIEMVVVGPEEPLVRGIFDFFGTDDELEHIPVIGPSQEGAQLEGSKAFAKEFMTGQKIPTADYQEFTADTLQEGLDFLDKTMTPIVLKADGLAAGKGVLILEDREEAKREFRAMLDGKFGDAGTRVVIESFLDGIEFSVFVLTDGRDYKILPVAKDYKRIGEGDTGLNTGGMGAVSPVNFVDDKMMEKVEKRVIIPTIKGLQQRDIIYQGFIFIGLISVGGEPFVIEYNCRMGDPETEVVFPRLKNDLTELMVATANGTLSEITIEEDTRAATTIMLVSGGYPEAYEKGKVITNLDQIKDSTVFHAGTKMENNQVVTNGGRVLAITSFGDDFKEALAVCKKNAELIEFEGKYFRGDIGMDLMED